METKIREKVDTLFKNFEQDESTRDIKEEMISNLRERITDLMEQGHKKNEAIDIAFGNCTDESELKKIFNFKSISNLDFSYTMNKIPGIISIVVFLLVGFIWDLWHPGWFVFLIAFACSSVKLNDVKTYILPTATVVYGCLGFIWGLWHPGWLVFPFAFMILAMIDRKNGALLIMSIAIYLVLGTLFELWLIGLVVLVIATALIAGRDEIVAGLWMLSFAVYLYLGFGLNLWHPGWILFIVSFALTVIISEKSIVGFSWLFSIAAYLFIGFEFDLWHPGWIMFIVVIAITAYLENDSEDIKIGVNVKKKK